MAPASHPLVNELELELGRKENESMGNTNSSTGLVASRGCRLVCYQYRRKLDRWRGLLQYLVSILWHIILADGQPR